MERRKPPLSPLGLVNAAKKKRHARSQEEVNSSLYQGENKVKLTPLDPYNTNPKPKKAIVFRPKQQQCSEKNLNLTKFKLYALKPIQTVSQLPKIINPTRTVTPYNKQHSKDINLVSSLPPTLLDFGIFSERDRLEAFSRKFQTLLKKKFEGGLMVESDE